MPTQLRFRSETTLPRVSACSWSLRLVSTVRHLVFLYSTLRRWAHAQPLSTRSALITELIAGARTSEPEIASSMVHALASVCLSAGKNLGAPSKVAIEELVMETFDRPGLGTSPSPTSLCTFSLAEAFAHHSEPFNDALSRVVAGLALHDPESVRSIIE